MGDVKLLALRDAGAGAPDIARAQAPPTGRECEIRLQGPPQAMRAAAQKLGLADAPGQLMRAIYYDTQDCALERARIALRVRRAGHDWTATLKWPRAGDGAFSRGEAEAPARKPDASGPPDLSALDANARDLLQACAGDAPLAPRFETHVRRRACMIERDATRIEAALDSGAILAGDQRARIAEIELEWKAGPPAGLYALARELVELGLRLAPRAKSERGGDLAAGRAPAPARATPVTISPEATTRDASAEDALLALVENGLSHFLGAHAALAGEQAAESVHQMRVALRRLRAALRLFERLAPDSGLGPLRAEAGRLASALGPARELDVFLEGLDAGAFEAAQAEAGLQDLRARAQRRRDRAHRDARALLAHEPAASLFTLDLQAFAAARGWRGDPVGAAWAGAPARELAATALAALDRRACKRGKRLRALDAPARHELRIALKNLRYAAEMFASLYAPEDMRAFLKRISRLQEDLGVYNDAVCAAALAQSLSAGLGAQGARAAGVAQGWSLRGAHAADDDLRKAFRRFRDAARPWA